MQEEVTQKTISLSIRATKITADLLKQAMREFVRSREKSRQKQQSRKQAKEVQKDVSKSVHPRGKQTLKKLMEQGSELKNIEVTDKNIKSFDRVARRYGIDYSLKKDISTTPPRYMVFFKAKDVDVMTAAFKEYAGINLKKTKRVSVRKKLVLAKERIAKQRERQKDRQKDRGQAL